MTTGRSDLLISAYHEAGHVVAAWCGGIAIKSVTLEPQPGAKAQTEFSFTDAQKQLLRTGDPNFYRTMSIVGLGGMAADYLHWKEAGGNEDEMITGDQGDREQVRERLEKCGCRDATDFDAFFSMTIFLLGDPATWPLVGKVAKMALKAGLLDSRQLDNLSRSAPAMSAEFWRSLEAKRAEYLANPPYG